MKSMFRPLLNSNFIKLLFVFIIITHTNSILNLNSSFLGNGNVCSSDEKEKSQYNCEDNCLCDREYSTNEFKIEILFLNDIRFSKQNNIKTKNELIEQKSNSPPITYLF